MTRLILPRKKKRLHLHQLLRHPATAAAATTTAAETAAAAAMVAVAVAAAARAAAVAARSAACPTRQVATTRRLVAAVRGAPLACPFYPADLTNARDSTSILQYTPRVGAAHRIGACSLCLLAFTLPLHMPATPAGGCRSLLTQVLQSHWQRLVCPSPHQLNPPWASQTQSLPLPIGSCN